MTEFNFEQWLAGVKTPTKAVTVFTRPDLLSQERDEHELERSLGEKDPLEESKTVFYLAGLSAAEERAIADAYPDPDTFPMYPEPAPVIAERATVEQSEAYLAAWKAYETNRELWQQEHIDEIEEWREESTRAQSKRGAERIARAIVKIKVGSGEPQTVSLRAEQVEALGERIGEPQLRKLVDALQDLTINPPKEPDPLS